MEKTLILALLTLSLTAGGQEARTPLALEAIPDDYSLAQAKLDGCVVHENDDITHGSASFEAFVKKAEKGEKCAVRLVNYYTMEMPFSFGEEQFDADQFPMMFVEDLVFDGKGYTLRWYEGDQEIVKHYPYLKRYEGSAESFYARYASYIRYVLTNDNTLTWEQLLAGNGGAAETAAAYEHTVVYTDLIGVP